VGKMVRTHNFINCLRDLLFPSVQEGALSEFSHFTSITYHSSICSASSSFVSSFSSVGSTIDSGFSSVGSLFVSSPPGGDDSVGGLSSSDDSSVDPVSLASFAFFFFFLLCFLPRSLSFGGLFFRLPLSSV